MTSRLLSGVAAFALAIGSSDKSIATSPTRTSTVTSVSSTTGVPSGCSKPAAPANLRVASIQGSTVELMWSPAEGATSYTTTIGSTPGGDDVLFGHTSAALLSLRRARRAVPCTRRGLHGLRRGPSYGVDQLRDSRIGTRSQTRLPSGRSAPWRLRLLSAVAAVWIVAVALFAAALRWTGPGRHPPRPPTTSGLARSLNAAEPDDQALALVGHPRPGVARGAGGRSRRLRPVGGDGERTRNRRAGPEPVLGGAGLCAAHWRSRPLRIPPRPVDAGRRFRRDSPRRHALTRLSYNLAMIDTSRVLFPALCAAAFLAVPIAARQAGQAAVVLRPQDARTLDGKPGNLAQYKGKVSLVVNVASKCGYTPQYEGLETAAARDEGQGLQRARVPEQRLRRSGTRHGPGDRHLLPAHLRRHLPDVREGRHDARAPGSPPSMRSSDAPASCRPGTSASTSSTSRARWWRSSRAR